jgi:hypothetical protein
MTGTSTASTTQRSTRQRELNLGTLQSGQEEDFTSTQMSYNNTNSSNQLSNLQQTRTTTPVQVSTNMSSSSSSSTSNLQHKPPLTQQPPGVQQHPVIDTKNLYYNRFINKHPPAQPAPSSTAPVQNIPKTSSAYEKVPNKLTKYQSSHSSSTVTSTTTSSTSFPTTAAYQQQQQRVVYTSQHDTVKQIGAPIKNKYPISSAIENTPPQSPLCAPSSATTPYQVLATSNNRLDDSNEVHSTINEFVSPLKANRLRPLRQQTRNAVMNILDNNEVVLEFIKAKNSKQRIIEVIRISPDGDQVIIYQPNSGKGFPVTDRPTSPPRDKGHFLEYDYQNLPQKYWKKYLYASR